MKKTGTVPEKDLQIIQEIIGPQLKQGKRVKVLTTRGGALAIDYCIINDGNQHFSNEIFL